MFEAMKLILMDLLVIVITSNYNNNSVIRN